MLTWLSQESLNLITLERTTTVIVVLWDVGPLVPVTVMV
jgi:hypothetical protein